MQPYATVSDPSPLNGNRAPVINNSNSNNVNKSFFTEYRTQILYSIGVIVAILFLSIVIKKRRSFYDIGKVQIGKKDKKDKKDITIEEIPEDVPVPDGPTLDEEDEDPFIQEIKKVKVQRKPINLSEKDPENVKTMKITASVKLDKKKTGSNIRLE